MQKWKVNRILKQKIFVWLNKIDRDEKIPKNIKAVNIGIFETKTSYSLYFIGSNKYTSESNDWACNEDYTPKNKYLQLEMINLRAIYPWKEFLRLVSKEIGEYLKSQDHNIINKIEYVTAGFDDGDLILIKNKSNVYQNPEI